MGTGKTTVARLLAEHRRVELLDTDKLIEARDGRSIREIFSESGETAFREIESEVLRECLARPGSPVIAGAGGVVVLKVVSKKVTTDKSPKMVFGL
jgi:shikimate kinase